MIYFATCSHYEILGVAHHATAADVEAAYARRISELPSSFLRQFALRAMTGRCDASLRVARETLSDPSRRSHYDATLLSPYFWVCLL